MMTLPVRLRRTVRFFYFFVAMMASPIAVSATAAPSDGTTATLADIRDYFAFLGSANHYSAMEGAGSHGSLGFGLGVGASQHAVPQNVRLIDDQVRSRDKFATGEEGDAGSEMMVPRLYFHKGLPWPIDLGVSLAKLPDTSATTAGGYVQWTLYEGFAMPAVAIRGKYSRMMGLPSTEFQSTSAEAVVSYGFFRIFTAYGNYGVNYHQASIQTQGETGTSLVLAEADATGYNFKSYESNMGFGLQAQILPQILVASVENRRVGGEASWLAKISLGL